MTPTMTVSIPTDREITLQRTFDAPRELVWEALTTPEHIRQWWGWSDWTMTVCEGDFRPGGTYRFVGVSPDGSMTVPFKGECLESDPPSRIVYTEIYDVEPFNQGEPAVVTSVLTEDGGHTTLTVTVRYASREVRDTVLATGMEKGAAHSYDRLEALLRRLGA